MSDNVKRLRAARDTLHKLEDRGIVENNLTMEQITAIRIAEFAIDEIRSPDAQPVDRWINAQTNPPIATDGKTSDYVLVLRESGYQCVCYYVYDDDGNYWMTEDEKSMYEIDEVTHWQPLPEPPKKG